MNYERMTLKLQEALQESTSIAQKKDHSEVGTEHLLFAFLTFIALMFIIMYTY